ncbi:MAG: hypothetical protein CBB60_000770 [Armatimonadetes bacterium Cent15-Ar3]|nr:MAG: hypothetical protein CBB60_000770 [Armatimonadetes bacterium Cent15-Ar3]
MRLLTSILIGAVSISAFGQIQPVSWKNVNINDSFWAPRQKVLGAVTMREQLDQLVAKKYKQNFERAAARQSGGYVGYVFNDSDVYKVLEAASYVLGKNKLAWLDQEVDNWITLISKAQGADGYLDTAYQLDKPDRKWTNLRDDHELYCAGHLFEAAAAHYEATGKTNFLKVATKLADHIEARFGEGKKMGYPGHPECELALMKLWRATGEQRYFKLAQFFIEKRGTHFFATEHNTPEKDYDGTYWSDNVPIREHSSIVGHAVRAAYLFSGVTDLAHETHDHELKAMLDRVWKSTALKRMFITGGIGPSGSNEGFTVDYDLPTFTAYQESCASIANALWNYRLALLNGEGKFADVMEQAIYNGALAGINMAGDKYYYVNPLASTGGHHRQDWFGCACCPPNLARMIGQMGGLSYGTTEDQLYVMLYVGGDVTAKVAGAPVKLDVKTNYPWDGKVKLTVHPGASRSFGLSLRQPGWGAISGLTVNKQSAKTNLKDGFLSVRRVWKEGDVVELEIPMPVRKVVSHPSVKDTQGMFALKRGPLVYCLEEVDNPVDMDRVGVPINSDFVASVDPKLFNTTTVLEGEGYLSGESSWVGRLFQSVAIPQKVKLKAIPYFMWDNRKPGNMRVWLSPNPAPSPMRGLETTAKVSVSFESGYAKINGVKDGFTPTTSNPNSPQQLHFWSHLGGKEWVRYDFPKETKVASMRVFWFDDTGRGAVRIPSSWQVEALIKGTWTPLKLIAGEKYGTALDIWNEVRFAPVSTTALRLTLNQQNGFATGIHEWQVFGED